MKVRISEAQRKLKQLLALSRAPEKDVDLVVRMRLEYDLHQNTFSGFSRRLDSAIEELRRSSKKKWKFVVNRPSMKLVNANGRSARLVGMEILDILCGSAKKNGICLIGMYNSTYHGILETYCREIAKRGLIGIVSSNGGPQGVVPFGGRKDIMGTNPIAYGIPTNGMPIVFDAATAKYAYGSIGLAKERKQKLPKDSYLDRNGDWTTNPEKAVSIVPFGDHKGYAINLLLEIMTGALVRGRSGLQQHTESELGGIFIAIDPKFFLPLKEFRKQTTQLAKDISSVKPAKGFKEVRVPGYKGELAKQKALKSGYMEINDEVWKGFLKYYDEKML